MSDKVRGNMREWFFELDQNGNLIGFASANQSVNKEELFSTRPPVGVEREIYHVREINPAYDEAVVKIYRALKKAQSYERDQIFEEMGCPGFDGPMIISTEFDEALNAFDEVKG